MVDIPFVPAPVIFLALGTILLGSRLLPRVLGYLALVRKLTACSGTVIVAHIWYSFVLSNVVLEIGEE